MITSQLLDSLQCPVCRFQLLEPITLSCGFTVCRNCLPDRSPAAHDTFVCPIPGCTESYHLFGRAIKNDVVVSNLTVLLARFLPPLSTAYSSSSSSSSSDIDPADYFAVQEVDLFQTALQNLLICQYCKGTVQDPVTIHCGHTFCRICVLSMKIEANKCHPCMLPLPRFHRLKELAPNKILDSIAQQLQQEQGTDETPKEIYESNISIFDTGTTVLVPKQRARFTFPPQAPRPFPTQPIDRYNDLCLATVSRFNGRELAKVGTLARIAAVEHHMDGAIALEVVGLDRFIVNRYYHRNQGEVSADITIIPEDNRIEIAYAVSSNFRTAISSDDSDEQDIIRGMAIDIYCFMRDLAAHAPTSTLHTNVTGLLGPDWLSKAEAAHGQLPLPRNPNALSWWAATVLPLSASNRYTLLRTRGISARLSHILSWIRQLEGSWTRLRSDAIQAISTACLQQGLRHEQFRNNAAS